MLDFLEAICYLNNAATLSPEEKEKSQMLAELMPKTIIDAHAHNALFAQTGNIDEITFNHPTSTFLHYPVTFSKEVTRRLFPGISVRTLRFGLPIYNVDYVSMNSWIQKELPANDRAALFGVPEDIDYTIQELRSGKWSALKMYFTYTRPFARTILETFTIPILLEAEKLGLPIIVHLPRPLSVSSDEIIDLQSRFPQLMIVLAHLGSSERDHKMLASSFRRVADMTNCYMDTAVNDRPESIKLALDTMGDRRIIYGTDAPYHLLRFRYYDNPRLGLRLMTEQPYHWSDLDEFANYCHVAKGALMNHFSATENLINMLETEQAVTNVFHDNAMKLFKF